MSSSGRQGDKGEEIAVSCGDLESSITSKECTRITQEYSLEVVEPTDLERPHTPPVGYVTLSEHYLQFGVRFPLNPFFIEVLQYFGLTVFQIMPNGWAYRIGLFCLFAEQGIGPPIAEEFAWFYLVKSNKNDEGFYYFAKRPENGLQAVVRIRDNLGSWKESYFFTPEVQV